MESNKGVITVVVFILAIVIIVFVRAMIYSKISNKTIDKVQPFGYSKGYKQNNISKFTDKDRDMMTLIHELSTIYKNTDQYLNQ